MNDKDTVVEFVVQDGLVPGHGSGVYWSDKNAFAREEDARDYMTGYCSMNLVRMRIIKRTTEILEDNKVALRYRGKFE